MNRERFRLPPFECRAVTTALSEVFDWSIQYGGIPELWKQSQGEGVVVAVLDTGIDDAHPDLQGAIKGARDFTRSIYGYRDRQSHGTWCAGMIGARANSIGVRGLAPLSSLLIGKCLGDDGSGSEDQILSAFRWAWASGANIISMSLGGGLMSESFHQAIKQFVSEPEHCVICAAGNDGRDNSVNYPAKWSECIAVGAIDKTGKLTNFTSRGPEIDILAPGQDMLSTVPISAGQYGVMSGTSMATPYVAGVCALALAKHRKEQGDTTLRTAAEFLEHLRRTAKKDASGYGIINPEGILDFGERKATDPALPNQIDIFIGGVQYRGNGIQWSKVTK